MKLDLARRLSAASVSLLTVLAGLAVNSTAAQAIPPVEPGRGPPCSWVRTGDKSLCDGWVPSYQGQYNSVCRNTTPTQTVAVAKTWAGSGMGTTARCSTDRQLLAVGCARPPRGFPLRANRWPLSAHLQRCNAVIK
ncbi:hypothetical protein Afe04nite_34290 [Asanoa ferruginea]|nr:hypothetical protein Afe04nite_34290 [Asanoa ferruginea]